MDHRDSPPILEEADISSLFDQFDQYDSATYASGDIGRGLEDERSAPSLPIILMSAAGGIAAGIIGLYIAYIVLDLSVQLSAAVATLSLCSVLGFSSAGLSTLSGSRAIGANIALSCGLILMTLIFFGFCTLAGAVTATLILTWGG